MTRRRTKRPTFDVERLPLKPPPEPTPPPPAWVLVLRRLLPDDWLDGRP